MDKEEIVETEKHAFLADIVEKTRTAAERRRLKIIEVAKIAIAHSANCGYSAVEINNQNGYYEPDNKTFYFTREEIQSLHKYFADEGFRITRDGAAAVRESITIAWSQPPQ